MKTAAVAPVNWCAVSADVASAVRRVVGGGNSVLTASALASALRAQGWRVAENVSRRAFYQGRYVSNYLCPLLVESAGMIVCAEEFPARTIAEERVRQLRASLQLEAVWLVSASGEIVGCMASEAAEEIARE